MAIRPATPGGTTASNPFGSGGGGGGTNTTASTALTIPVRLPNGSIVNVSSQAEVDALRANYQRPQEIIDVGGGGSGGGGNGWQTAGDMAQTVGAFLAGRNLRDRVEDADDARARLNAARAKIEAARATNPDLAAAVLEALDAQRDLDDAQTDALDTQITAVDIAAGAGAVKVVGQFARGDMGFGGGGGGSGTGLALAAGGLGLGLLLTSERSRGRRR